MKQAQTLVRPTSSPYQPKYIPELDGLRALALLGVLAYHLSLEWLSLGWTGVSLFFVISGFLITGILLDAGERPRRLRNFYFRRALRILPIYYLTLAAVVAGALAGRQEVGDLGYYLTYTQNYALGLTNFIAHFPMMFNHSWSLAVEEQFYLLWPLAVLALSRRNLLILVVVLFALAPIARTLMLAVYPNPTLMYASLPTQVDSLAVGAGLAVLARSGLDPRLILRHAVWIGIASAVALGYLVAENGLAAYWHLDSWATQPRNLPTFSLLALLWGGVVALAVFGNGVLSSVLRLGLLRHLGRISYGLYMYHFPVYVLTDSFGPGFLPHGQGLLASVLPLVVKVGGTYLLALVSWHLVESPLLRLKGRFQP